MYVIFGLLQESPSDFFIRPASQIKEYHAFCEKLQQRISRSSLKSDKKNFEIGEIVAYCKHGDVYRATIREINTQRYYCFINIMILHYYSKYNA